MNVSNTTKNEYRADSIKKEYRIYFPDLDLEVGTGQIDSESMELIESLSESDSIEFVGCISSQFKITLHDVSDNLKGERIEAYVYTDNSIEEPICLFHGKVEDVSISANKSHKSLTAYDILYEKGDIEVANWYKGLRFPITLKNFRDSLFNFLEITQETITLPNDSIQIDKQYSPNTMKSLDVIKSICQINGVFGIINRDNKFEYRILPKSDSASVTEAIQYQKGLEFQEYIVNPVDKLTIRQTENDEGVSYGSGDNNYIIQGNMFTLNLEQETLETIAENIYPNVEGFYYTPFVSDNNGLPWIECGKDIVSYNVYDYDNSTPTNPVYKALTFFILRRELSGIQNLRDSYSAEGDEFQRIFVTDLQSKIDTIIEQIQQMSGKMLDYSLNYVFFTNESKIVVSDGETQEIVNVNFSVSRETQVLVNMEYLLFAETKVNGINYYDVNATINYYLDNVLIDTRIPKEVYIDGNHILNLLYPLIINDRNNHKWKVTITSNGGSITIDIGQAQNIISGQGLVVNDWDGNIDIYDSIPTISVNTLPAVNVVGITEDVSTSLHDVIGNNISDNIGLIAVDAMRSVSVVGITESVDVTVEEVQSE